MSIVIYEVSVNSDLIEGRGHNVTVGYFTNKNDAEMCESVQDKCMGGGSAASITPHILYNTFEGWKSSKSAEVRQRALKKLSWEERLALGLEKFE